MTGLQHVFLAYGAALVLLGGYAVLQWLSLCRASHASHKTPHRR